MGLVSATTSRVQRLLVPLVVAYCALSVALSKTFTALYPEHTDAHLFAYIGGQWLRGAIPYIDLWDNKPPGLLALIAAVFSIVPDSFAALAVTEGLFSAAAIAIVFALCRRASLPFDAAVLSTLAAAGASNLIYYTDRGLLAEVYFVLPAAAAMLCFVVACPDLKLGWVYAAGLCAGAAALFKPTGLSPLLAQLAYLPVLLTFGRAPLSRLAIVALVLVGGALTSWLPMSLYFWSKGALGDLFYASFAFNVEYGVASQSHPFIALVEAVERLTPIATLAAATLVLATLWATWIAGRWRRTSPSTDASPILFTPLVLLWVAVDLAGALAGGRMYAHYFLPLTISGAVAAGFAYWWVTYEKVDVRAALRSRLAICALILGPIVFGQISDLGELAISIKWGRPAHPTVRAGQYLRSIRDTSETTLFTWDYLPAIYFHSGLASPVRQLDAHQLEASPAAYERFGPQLIAELRAGLPSFVVDRTQDVASRARDDRFYREFRQILDAEYEVLDHMEAGNIWIYRRRNGRESS